MERQDVIDAVKDMFSAYEHSFGHKDTLMMEIMFCRKKYEQNLDEMWSIYLSGNPKQIVEYEKGVNDIKNAGLRVLRNSSGKHKIELKK